MNPKHLLLASSAMLALASCSDNKSETATTTTTTETPTATTPMAVDTLAYRTPAADLATRVASDISVTDTATVSRIKNVYYNRGRIMANIQAKADTTGNYAAMKMANDQTSQAMKATVTPAQYTTYASKEGSYYNGPYTSMAPAAPATTTVQKSTLAQRVSQGSGVKKLENSDDDKKIKFENGAKIKRSDDGSLKIKRADGTKIKIDENGHRTVKKGLF